MPGSKPQSPVTCRTFWKAIRWLKCCVSLLPSSPKTRAKSSNKSTYSTPCWPGCAPRVLGTVDVDRVAASAWAWRHLSRSVRDPSLRPHEPQPPGSISFLPSILIHIFAQTPPPILGCVLLPPLRVVESGTRLQSSQACQWSHARYWLRICR